MQGGLRSLGRSLHLVDIENLAGGSAASDWDVIDALDEYRSTVAVGPNDHVVIASGRGLALTAGRAWPGPQLLVGSGVDGADLRLLEVARPVAWTAARFARVVIGSGDGIFAGLATDLRQAGLVVCAVSRPESLAICLRRAASVVRCLPPRQVAA